MPSLAHTHSLRKGRASLPGQCYILTTVTHGRVTWFLDFELGCLAARTLTRTELWPDARLLAWVVMPDHVHLLVELGDKESVSLVMQRVKSGISRALRRGLCDQRIWQSGYHDHALRNAENLRHAARYLIANPLRAGLVDRIGDYPFWDAVWLAPDHDTLNP